MWLRFCSFNINSEDAMWPWRVSIHESFTPGLAFIPFHQSHSHICNTLTDPYPTSLDLHTILPNLLNLKFFLYHLVCYIGMTFCDNNLNLHRRSLISSLYISTKEHRIKTFRAPFSSWEALRFIMFTRWNTWSNTYGIMPFSSGLFPPTIV